MSVINLVVDVFTRAIRQEKKKIEEVELGKRKSNYLLADGRILNTGGRKDTIDITRSYNLVRWQSTK